MTKHDCAPLAVSPSRETLVRFEDKFIPEPMSGCWLWFAGHNGRGYGVFRTRAPRRMYLAHRYSWALYRGPIGRAVHVLHRCDNPYCVNPDHLFLGSHAENVADMVSKSRQSNGSRNGMAKLTDDDVRAIRQSPDTCRSIAAQFGVSTQEVSDIQIGRFWKSGPGIIRQKQTCGENHRNSKLTETEARFVLSDNTLTHQALADLFGVTRECISRIKQGRSWKHLRATMEIAA